MELSRAGDWIDYEQEWCNESSTKHDYPSFDLVVKNPRLASKALKARIKARNHIIFVIAQVNRKLDASQSILEI